MRFDTLPGMPLMFGRNNTATAANTNLNSAFTYNSAGACITYRFAAPRAWPLTHVYVYCPAVTGAPTAITAELRNYSSISKPGATVHASAVADASGHSGKWLRFTFASPYTLTAGTPYYLCIYNATGTPGSNFAQVMHSGVTPAVDGLAMTFRPLTSTNGFSSTTAVNNPGAIVLRVASGAESHCFGCPYTSVPSIIAGSQQRGILIPALDAPIEIAGLSAPALSGVTALQILKSSSLPGATPGAGELDVPLATGVADGTAIVFSPFTLRRGVSYRVVLSFGSSSSDPGYLQIDDAATYSDVPATGHAGLKWTEASGGAWVDSADRLPRLSLLVSRLPPTVRRLTL